MHAKSIFILAGIAATLLLHSCTATQKGLFAKKTAHEAYTDQLEKAGLQQTLMGSKWLQAATTSKATPLTIELPYKETGYFAADYPNAAGYRFNARQGQILQVLVSAKPGPALLFADVWQQEDNGTLKTLGWADSTTAALNITLEKNGLYQLRLQPELLFAGEYTLTITANASLAFPVPSTANPAIGSFWGADRDGGKRSHEGIDIFGKLRTPVVAVADGYINSTRSNNLGGKVIFLRPSGADYSVYYAHLDSQLVQEGDRVTTGQVIGLMGNTGNAKNTATHLHFGIYTNAGAIDPLPFVNPKTSEAKNITADISLLQSDAAVIKETGFKNETNKAMPETKLAVGRLVKMIAASAAMYKVRLTDNSEGFIKSNQVSRAVKASSFVTVKQRQSLFDRPVNNAATRLLIPAGTKLPVYAKENNFVYTQFQEQYGWLAQQ